MDETTPAKTGPTGKVRLRLGRITLSSGLLGALFLMASSAIGPGFITQTTNFTAQLGATFAFAIVLSTLVDIAVQLNVWRVIGVANLHAQDLANKVLPGAGYALAAFVIFGGLIFNVGNIAGTGLGLDAMIGLDPQVGAAASVLVATLILAVKQLGRLLDRVIIVLGVMMVCLMLYVAVVSAPPVGEALRQSVMPETLGSDVFLATLTIIGATVGGYVSYAGAHRLIETGHGGRENVGSISRASVAGVLVTAVMRVFLFLAVLGVVSAGAVVLGTSNPPAAVFHHAAGEVGLRMFGVVLWAAGISSVIGASYTSVSFVATLHPWLDRHRGLLAAVFNGLALSVILFSGQAPDTLLILAGALNGLILPIGLGFMLWIAARRSRELLHGYHYPRWLIVVGVLAWGLTVYMASNSLGGIVALWQ